MSEDSLLDVFVNIATKGLTESQAAIDAFTEKTKKAFGDVASVQAAVAKRGTDASVIAAERAAKAVQDATKREMKLRQDAAAALIKSNDAKSKAEQKAQDEASKNLQRSIDRAQKAQDAADKSRIKAAEAAAKAIQKQNEATAKAAQRAQEKATKDAEAAAKAQEKANEAAVKREMKLRQDAAAALIKSNEAKLKAEQKAQEDAAKALQRSIERAQKAQDAADRSRIKAADAAAKAEQKQNEVTARAAQRAQEKATKDAASASRAQRKADEAALRVRQKADEAAARAAARQAAQAPRIAAREQASSLGRELLLFERDKREIEVGIKLVADPDINRQFAAIQSGISEQAATFRLAAPGTDGDDERARALERIVNLRTQDLTVLNEQVDSEIRLRGLEDARDNKTENLRNARNAAQQLALELKEVNSEVTRSGSTRLRDDFDQVARSAAKLKQELSEKTQRGDLIGAQEAQRKLDDLKPELQRIKSEASEKVPINIDSSKLKKEFGFMKREFQALEELLRFETAGSLSLPDKLEVAKLKKEMADAETSFLRIAASTDKTASDFQDMAAAVQSFKNAAASVEQIQRGALKGGANINALSNNAYQLGQAFEDAAVGFSLNGVTGAVRGAANNINFLINNLAQAGTLTSLLGQRTADLIPLYGGIATAAVFILPALYEWYKSLTEIEDKTLDISDILKREFEDIEFNVSLVLDERSAARAIFEAESAVDVIEALIKQAEESEDLRVKLTLELDERSRSKSEQEYKDFAKTLSTKFQEEVQFAGRQRFSGGEAQGDGLAIPFVPRDLDENELKILQTLENINNAYDAANAAREQAFEDSKKGIIEQGTLETAVSGLQFVLDQLKELVKLGLITQEQSDEYEASLTAQLDIEKKLNEEAKKRLQLEKAAFKEGIEASVRANEKLNRELQFEQEHIDDAASAAERLLFKQGEQILAQEELNRKLQETQGINEDTDFQIALANEAIMLEHEIELLQEISGLQKDIKKAEERAKEDSIRATEKRKNIEERILALINKQNKSKNTALGNSDNIIHTADSDNNQLKNLYDDLRKAQEEETKQLEENKKAIDELKEALILLSEALKGRIKPIFAPENAPAEQAKKAEKKTDQQAEEERKQRNKEIAEKNRIRRQEFDEREKQKAAEKKQLEDQIKFLEDEPKRAKKAAEDQQAEEKRIRDEKQKAAEEAARIATEAAQQAASDDAAAREKLVNDIAEQAKKDAEAAKKKNENQQEQDRNLRLSDPDPAVRQAERDLIMKEKEAAIKEQARARQEQDALQDPTNFNQRQIEEQAKKKLDAEIEFMKRDPSFKITEEEYNKALQEEIKWIQGNVGNQQSQMNMPFSKADINAQITAQANANANALQDTNFTSTTLQTLIATSNQILAKMNENIENLDVNAGLG